MSEADPRPVLETRVAHLGYGDTRFCGHSVREELVERHGYWTSISLAIGGPRLSEAEEQLLDGLSVAALNADPRIWPLKIARLLASEGSTIVGIGGALIALEGGLVGAPAFAGAARQLLELEAFVEAGGELELELRERLGRGWRLMGFGVPYRDEDERVLAARWLIERDEVRTKPYWRLLARIEEIVVAEQPALKANIAAKMCAIFLDLGFGPAQIDTLAMLVLLNNMVANAREGAEQGEAMLRQLPEALIRYEGAAPRRSPRALQAERSALSEP